MHLRPPRGQVKLCDLVQSSTPSTPCTSAHQEGKSNCATLSKVVPQVPHAPPPKHETSLWISCKTTWQPTPSFIQVSFKFQTISLQFSYNSPPILLQFSSNSPPNLRFNPKSGISLTVRRSSWSKVRTVLVIVYERLRDFVDSSP